MKNFLEPFGGDLGKHKLVGMFPGLWSRKGNIS
jgi:hypothetical protein